MWPETRSGSEELRFRLSRHVEEEMRRRGIPSELLESVLRNPEQVVPEYGSKKAYQSHVEIGGKIYLLRAIVAEDVDPPVVVTAYRTTRIARYWRTE